MWRITQEPCADRRERARALGFAFAEIEGEPYWDETASYRFTAGEVDTLDDATAELECLCRAAVEAYLREDRFGPSRDQQLDAVRRGGAEDLDASPPRVYADTLKKVAKQVRPWTEDKKADPFPERTRLAADLRPGDVVVLQAIDRLGPNRRDIREALAVIGAKGASVYDVEADELIGCGPEALRTAAALDRAEEKLRGQHAENMRRAKAAMGDAAKGGGRQRWSATQLAAARPIWFDLSKTGADVRRITGIPEKTLYTRFGERGRPLFGRDGERSVRHQKSVARPSAKESE